MVSALLMKHLGCSDQEIIDDYLLSRENLEPLLKKYAAFDPNISLGVITPCERYMREFLMLYNSQVSCDQCGTL